MKKVFYSLALMMGVMTFTACSSDSDDNGGENNDSFSIVTTAPIVDNDTYAANTTAANYADKAFGQAAIDGCIGLVGQLESANAAIASSKLSETQEAYLRKVLENLVSNVIVPTYTKLADETEALENTLKGLTVNTITQAQINSACDDFKQARKYWEQSEAFLMGAASDFDSGEKELAYAQTICKLLKERCFQLQCAWDGGANSSRLSVVKAAGLDYQTENGLSFGDNLTKAGISGSNSTFASLKAAIAQVLSNDEGSCVAIANEVGTAKIANPFANGDVSYVESPYSYNSITDFRDNIRSIRNIWLGSTNKSANQYSFHTFFASVKSEAVNKAVENGYVAAIEAISNMPSPFVKYCCTIWNINFEDDDDWEVEE